MSACDSASTDTLRHHWHQSDLHEFGGFGGLGLEWRSRNVSFFAAAEYLALADNSNVISGRAGLRVGF